MSRNLRVPAGHSHRPQEKGFSCSVGKCPKTPTHEVVDFEGVVRLLVCGGHAKKLYPTSARFIGTETSESQEAARQVREVIDGNVKEMVK